MNELAILLAAGCGTRLRPITNSTPKPLVKVNGKPMIETVIDSLIARDVKKFIVVTGYLYEQFEYLAIKYSNLELVYSKDYDILNNISSLYIVCEELLETECNVFICDSDLYVSDSSIFNAQLDHSCYYGRMVKGHSDDWVFEQDEDGRIIRVGKVGDDCFNMVGVAWFKKDDARLLGELIKARYGTEGFEDLFWDDVVNENLDKLNLTVHEVFDGQLVEIDTVEELKAIDTTYV